MSTGTAAEGDGKDTSAIDAFLFKKSDNKRSIPEANFLDNVEALCQDRTPMDVVSRLQELYSKFQYMQSSMIAQRSSLKTKLPDIVSALETVQHLTDRRDKAQEGEAAEYTYQLSENLYAKASVPPTNSVCLWLGANCMLEYTLEEASELLKTNEANARTTLKSVEEDMAFLRDQLTTCEVNIARTHNYGVKLRQKAKADEVDGGSKPAEEVAQKPVGQPASFAPPPRTGQGEGYTWKQEKEEVEVSVKVPEDAQKGDVKVTILVDSLRVEHQGTVLLEGQLAGKCSPNGSTWTMNSGRVEISLEKADSSMWPSFFEKNS